MILLSRCSAAMFALAFAWASAPAAHAAAREVRGVVVHRTAHSVVVSQNGELVTFVGARTRQVGRRVTATAQPRGDGTYTTKALRFARRGSVRASAVPKVAIAGTVTYASRSRQRYTVSAGGASLVVTVSGRTHGMPRVGAHTRVTASLRSDGRLKERHRSMGARRTRALVSGRILGVARAAQDGEWTLFVSADDAGRSRAAIRATVADSTLPSFVRSAGGGIKPAYDWTRRTVSLDRPPRAWASGPQVLVTLALSAARGGTPRAIAVDRVDQARARQAPSGSTPGSQNRGGTQNGNAGSATTGGGTPGGGTVPPTLPPPVSPPPVSPPLRPYAAQSPWNTPVPAGVAVDPRSAQLVQAISDNDRPLTTDVDQYTIPVYTFDSATPRHTVRLSGYFSAYDDGDDSRVGFGESPTITNVPVPPGAESGDGSDGQIVFLDHASHTEYSFWQWRRNSAGNFTATNGYRYHTSADYHGRFADGLAGRGAGLPYFAGLVRRWEIDSGRIDHALAFAYESPAPTFVYPASKTDGDGVAGVDVPEGARLQLNPSLTEADFDSWGLSGPARIIARALQQYGMYVVDNSGSSKLYLEDRKTAGWDDSVTRDLVSDIPWSAFRVVAPPAGG